MAHQHSNNSEELSEVNVIPLADLALVLLIIMMVISPMIAQTLMHISPREAVAAVTHEEVVQPETPVIISYSPDELKMNGIVMVSPLDLVRKLDEVMPNRKDKSVTLTAAPTLKHGEVVSMMDLIRRHGAESLTMVKWDVEDQAAAVHS